MQDFNFVLFGATGDLAMRKIFPSLFYAHRDGFISCNWRLIATGRTKLDRDSFMQTLEKKSRIHIDNCNNATWDTFINNIDYISINLQNTEDFENLKKRINAETQNIVVYFSISPEFFIQACKNLAQIGLNDDRVKIVLEKPLGRDLKSCNDINEEISRYYKEQQVYRIDHYLGKESVQNLLILRAYNPILSCLWDKEHINHIEISVFETLGVENRGEFYERMGAVRDMLQNHMLQILSLIAMKIPEKMDANSIRSAKLAILKSLKPWDIERLKTQAIRAQYDKNGELRGYRDEEHVDNNSNTETFMAIKVELLDPKWQGVPFYLRTGKRMAESFVQVVISFKANNLLHANKLIISLQPHSTISLNLQVKKIGNTMEYEEKTLHMNLDSKNIMQPYEKLILDVIESNPTSFNHKEELEVAWRFVDPIIESWQNNESPLYFYPAGSFGPKEAFDLIQQDGHAWHNA